MFSFDAAAIWVACERSMPAAVRFVRISNNTNADARAILKTMAGIGSLRSAAGGVSGSGSRREKTGKTTSLRGCRAQFLEQPGARGLPVPVGGGGRDPERLAGFLEGQTTKEPQLRELTFAR